MTPKETEEIYVGLDVGSTKVCCIVGLHEKNTLKPSIIGVGIAPNTGVRKGVVTDLDETVTAITTAVDEAERISGVPIKTATVGIDGAHISDLDSRGAIAVGRNDTEITIEDLQRAEEAATAIHLPPNREIVQVFARDWLVDEQAGIRDPIGMKGIRLEVDTHIIIGSTPVMKNLYRCLDQVGLSAESRVLIPIAAAKTALTKQQKEIGAAVIDIGGETTGLAVFEEGNVIYANILPVGSNHITNDLAIGLKTSIEIAEKIKLKYVKADLTKTELNEKITIEELEDENKIITAKELNRITKARVEEILQLIAKELKKINKVEMLPGGVILTGGGANLPNIDEVAKSILNLPVTIGKPEGFSGIIDKINNPLFVAPIGLMLEDMLHEHTFVDKTNLRIGNTVEKIKNKLKNFLP